MKLKGVADHSEEDPIGGAYSDELLRWKLQQIKAMGCNSIRTAHNPQTPIFYDLCDEMGILVMDKLFDGWSRKAPQDYGKRTFGQCNNRSMKLTVNGKDKVLLFPNTKNYGSDWKILKQLIPLNSGANSIHLTTVEDGGMCIGEMMA